MTKAEADNNWYSKPKEGQTEMKKKLKTILECEGRSFRLTGLIEVPGDRPHLAWNYQDGWHVSYHQGSKPHPILEEIVPPKPKRKESKVYSDGNVLVVKVDGRYEKNMAFMIGLVCGTSIDDCHFHHFEDKDGVEVEPRDVRINDIAVFLEDV